MPAAAIYVRQSLDRSGDEAAVQRQQAECEDLCAKRGWVVVEVYKDNDKSASSGKPRPDYRRLMRDIPSGRFSVVVAWHPDRLHRQPSELEDFIKLIEAHRVQVETVTAGIWDLSTPSGRLVARQLGAVARYEVEHKSDRQRAGNRQRALDGTPHSGPRPFGYRREVTRNDAGNVLGAILVVEPLEAEAVRQGYQLLLAGAKLRGIAAGWNASGFRTSAGQPWTGSSVCRRLKSPAYAGRTVYDGEEVGTGNWEPLVTEETWRAAVALLNDPARRTATGYTRRYLLPGLALCGVGGCGAKVMTGRSHRGQRTYICGSRHLARAAEPIDEIITALVIERLSRDDARELLHDDARPGTAALTEEAQALRARQDEFASMLADGAMNRRQFELANGKVTADLQRIESQLSYTNRADVLRDLIGKDVAKVWERLSVDRRTTIIGELMVITLLPPGKGKRSFDPSTVRIEWK